MEIAQQTVARWARSLMLTARVEVHSCVAQLHLITLIMNAIGAHLRDSPNAVNPFAGVGQIIIADA
jgi:hypothetical protein